MKATIHQPEFLSYLGFFDKVSQCDKLLLLDGVNFRKNYFQNRNRVMGHDKPMWLTVPVEKHNHKPINEIRITSEWSRRREKYLKTLDAVYKNAPYKGSVLSELEDIWMEDYELLVELNCNLMIWAMKYCGLEKPVELTSFAECTKDKAELIVDLCKHYEVTEYLAGISGKDYLSKNDFEPIKLSHHEYRIRPYKQCHSSEFVPYLSVLDAMLNQGHGLKWHFHKQLE